jgi:anti-sigma factor RsiW
MKCNLARIWFFRKIDGELSVPENKELDDHLTECTLCAREYKLLNLPRRLAEAIPVLTPSPYFYRTLRARIESENQSITVWQIALDLARQVVPALAAVTLAFLSIFAYYQARSAPADLYHAYDRIFVSEDQSNGIVVSDQSEITDESILRAIAERKHSDRH